MTQDELTAIAERRSYCAPFETRVSLTGQERDALVALARDGMRWRFVRDNADITLDAPVWFTTDSGQKINVSAFARHEAERAVDAGMAKEQ